MLKYPLLYGDKQPAVEHTLNFVAKFATAVKNGKEDKSDQQSKEKQDQEDDDDIEIDPFLVKLFQFLLEVYILQFTLNKITLMFFFKK